ncbi:MAG: tRNA (adenosine(37)-N6)-dimethylallyltransferase MiaA [Bacteroidales bacterium]|nr:tRNA (adenosine(37)-N6)-dimethylallyltransferase MiaA [Bacteroidales bacterium]
MDFSTLKETKYNLITILGATAAGKTSLAAHLANNLSSEIISADSRQVYRGMDLGTGKDIDDYTIFDKKIKYHLIDIVDAGKKYNLFQYQKDFFKVFNEISKNNILPIMCGGTGLYIDAIVKNYELLEVPPNIELRKKIEHKTLEELKIMLSELKKLHNVSDVDTKKRAIRAIEIELFKKNNVELKSNFTTINSINFGVKFDRSILKERITKRLKERLENGMIDEVNALLQKGVSSDTLIYYGLEYKYITLFLLNKLNYDELFNKLNIAIHQFSKRQTTWFRRMEKQGVEINWIDGEIPLNKKLNIITEILNKKMQL